MSEAQYETDLAGRFARAVVPLLRDRNLLHAAISPWMTVPEAAAYMSWDERTVRRFIEQQDLPVHRPTPRSLRIHRDELDEWVRTHGGQ